MRLKGVWLCMKADFEQMAREGCGAIINTASLAGLTGFKTTCGYAASKHGGVGLPKTGAFECTPRIRGNCACRGLVDTDMLRDTMARRAARFWRPVKEQGTEGPWRVNHTWRISAWLTRR